jgi:hypothetical protein
MTYFNLTRPDSEHLLGEEGQKQTESRPCPITREHSDGRRRLGDLFFQLNHNSQDEMIIWGMFGCVIHQDVLAAFKKEGFTGYRLRPATVRFPDGTISQRYRELIVTGWAGIARPESGIRIMKSCPACHYKRYSGITDFENLIDWDQWTGEDFFILWPMPALMLITERVGHWLLSHKIKSFSLRGLEDFDPLVMQFGFTVGRLSDFLPEDLALRYGRSLGLE